MRQYFGNTTAVVNKSIPSLLSFHHILFAVLLKRVFGLVVFLIKLKDYTYLHLWKIPAS